jgi:hypothetical protein
MIHDMVSRHSRSAADLERGDVTLGTPSCPSSSKTCVYHALNSSRIYAIGPCQTHLGELFA